MHYLRAQLAARGPAICLLSAYALVVGTLSSTVNGIVTSTSVLGVNLVGRRLRAGLLAAGLLAGRDVDRHGTAL